MNILTEMLKSAANICLGGFKFVLCLSTIVGVVAGSLYIADEFKGPGYAFLVVIFGVFYLFVDAMAKVPLEEDVPKK